MEVILLHYQNICSTLSCNCNWQQLNVLDLRGNSNKKKKKTKSGKESELEFDGSGVLHYQNPHSKFYCDFDHSSWRMSFLNAHDSWSPSFLLFSPFFPFNLLRIIHPQLPRKRLDPLEAYIPAVILTEFQIKELGNILYVFFIFSLQMEPRKLTFSAVIHGDYVPSLLHYGYSSAICAPCSWILLML